MRYAAGLVLVLALISCRAPSTDTSQISQTEGPAATGFLSANTTPPDGASDTRDDGVMRDSYGRPFEYALLGKPLPAFTAPILGGGVFDSAAFDRWTIIDIWGIWCSDCRADGPYVDALSRAIAQDPDLDFLSIHVPASAARTSPEEMFGTFGSVDAYFRSVGHSYPVIVDTDARLRDALRISWTPSYLLVSPDGVVRGFRTELAAAGGEPVKDFLRDVARVKRDLRTSPRISEAGAMSLSGETLFTLRATLAAFPGHEVVSTIEGDDAEAIPVFLVRAQDGSIRFRVTSDWTRGYVGMVSTRDPAVEGPGGMAIGTTRLSVVPPTQREACRPERDTPGLITCVLPARASPGTFVLLFEPAPVDGDPVLVEMQYLPPPRQTKSP